MRAAEGSNHLGQWYDGAGFFGEADRVQPGASDVVIRMRVGGEISGVVRDDRGDPAPGATVTVVGCPGLCPLNATADASGAYLIHGIPPGPELRAYADGTSAGLLNAWYTAPGQVGDTTFDLAAGQVRGDLDFALTAGAVVRGRIQDALTGEPLPDVSLELVQVGNPLNSFLSRPVEEPAASTAQVIGPVPPGRYSLVVYPGADYLPVEVVASTGLDGVGLLDLSRGERAEFTMGLARQEAPVGGNGGGAGSAGQPDPVSGGWPGLFGGFLSEDGPGFLRVGAA